MTPFTILKAIAAPLPLSNVDTDKILPARFLKTVERTGLGAALFHALRYDPVGGPRDDFVLNWAPWSQAGILVALDNFGCGSSREHAPWALADFGIRCVIAPRFADIFETNCVKNGILTITLDPSQVDRLLRLASDPRTAEFTVDLAAQTIQLADGHCMAFEVGPQRKAALLGGLDDIDATLAKSAQIAAFEANRREPWLAGDPRLFELVSTDGRP